MPSEITNISLDIATVVVKKKSSGFVPYYTVLQGTSSIKIMGLHHPYYACTE